MSTEFILNLIVLGISIALGTTLLVCLKKSKRSLPETWQKSASVKNFRLSILLLSTYLSIVFIGEVIATSMAGMGIYNCYIIIGSYTLHIPFLLGFFFINTVSSRKRYVYIFVYLILVAHFIWMDYYNPRSVLAIHTSQVIDTSLFIAALLHLTDILVNPKSDYIKFQFRIDFSILIFFLLTTITSPFFVDALDPHEILFHLNTLIITLYYLSFAVIFTSEIIKLSRRH